MAHIIFLLDGAVLDLTTLELSGDWAELGPSSNNCTTMRQAL